MMKNKVFGLPFGNIQKSRFVVSLILIFLSRVINGTMKTRTIFFSHTRALTFVFANKNKKNFKK